MSKMIRNDERIIEHVQKMAIFFWVSASASGHPIIELTRSPRVIRPTGADTTDVEAALATTKRPCPISTPTAGATPTTGAGGTTMLDASRMLLNSGLQHITHNITNGLKKVMPGWRLKARQLDHESRSNVSKSIAMCPNQ